VTITDGSLAYIKKPRIYGLQEVTNTPDQQKNHPSKIAHFIWHSMSWSDQSPRIFVFEAWNILLLMLLIEYKEERQLLQVRKNRMNPQ
jgi:hypothetical protein